MEKLDERTYKFALRIVKLVNALPQNKVGDVLGHQVLRSGTSVGANLEEAFAASTKREFTRIVTIAQREAKETHYWLRLIRDSALIPGKQIEAIVQEALEIKLILAQTVITSKKSKTKNQP